MSAKQFTEEIGGSTSTISRHFRQLAEWGYIEVVEEREGGSLRGGVERIYAATQRDDLRLEDWAALSQAEREEKSENSIAFYFRRVSEAVEAATFDAEASRHWSWDAVTLDKVAWEQVSRHLDEILDWLPELEAESAQRLKEDGGEAIPATVGLALFRSPTPDQRRAAPAAADSTAR